MDNPDFDLLITDIDMPEMSGDELMLILRGESGYAKIPMLVVSGTIHMKTVVKLLDQGATTCISKPIKPEKLRTLITRYLAA